MAKRQKKPKKSVKPHTMYSKDGDSLKRTHSTCPKCGPGFFLAKHKNRVTCGHCGYCEFVSKKEVKPEVKKEDTPEVKKE